MNSLEDDMNRVNLVSILFSGHDPIIVYEDDKEAREEILDEV